MELIKQETEYTCGCASMRMVLNKLGLDIPSEERLAILLKTNDKQGTKPEDLVSVASEHFNLKVLEGQNSRVDEIEKLHQRGYVVLLIISIDVPHIVVYNGHNGNHVQIYDPWYGIQSVNKRKFDSNRQQHPHYRWRALKKEFKDLEKDGYDLKHCNHNKAFIAFKKK